MGHHVEIALLLSNTHHSHWIYTLFHCAHSAATTFPTITTDLDIAPSPVITITINTANVIVHHLIQIFSLGPSRSTGQRSFFVLL